MSVHLSVASRMGSPHEEVLLFSLIVDAVELERHASFQDHATEAVDLEPGLFEQLPAGRVLVGLTRF
jgi:hypothetical protein